MSWRGFIVESKDYMGYGKSISKLRFWLNFPRAFIRFYWFCYSDELGLKLFFKKYRGDK